MRPGWNQLDRQRRLRPCDYAEDPTQFGKVRGQRFLVPADGREIDAWVAHRQHLLICDWNDRGRRPSTKQLEQDLQITRQMMNRNARGLRWIGFFEAEALQATEIQRPVRLD